MKRIPLGEVVARVGTCRPGVIRIGTADFPYRLRSVREELERAHRLWVRDPCNNEVEALRLATAAMRLDRASPLDLLAA